MALVNTRLTNFFNTVSDRVLLVDKDEVIDYNPAAKALLGREAKHYWHSCKTVHYRSSIQRQKITINHRFSDVEIMVETRCYAVVWFPVNLW